MTRWSRGGTLALASQNARGTLTGTTKWRNDDVTDEHIKGTITKAEGKIEEGLGKLAGNKEQEAHGKIKQVQGDMQKSLGDIQDAVREPKSKP